MPLTWPLVQLGSNGEDVRTVQYLAVAHGQSVTVDGDFGPLTKAAVESFQAAHGLGVDGIVGNQTWPPLIIEVQSGSTGEAVRALQSQMHSRGDGSVIAIDGAFGPMTSEAVGGFQQLLGLTVDHIAGPVTWNHLVNGYLDAADPSTAAKDTFEAWAQNRKQSALLNATPGAVTELFSQSFSQADNWSFEGCQGAAGHTFCSWKRSNGKELRIGVENAVVAPFYAADQVEFT